MTAEQIRHCAEVALYTKVHAVRLMTAGLQALELARLFLELYHSKECSQDAFATDEEGQDLLVLVAFGYQRSWARQKKHQVQPIPKAVNIDQAVTDLCRTRWVLRILRQQASGRIPEAGLEALQFLKLREQVLSIFQPARIEPAHGRALLSKLFAMVHQIKANERNTRKDAVPYLATHRRSAKRPRGRSLGF